MTNIEPYTFTPAEIDGTALREDYVMKFLYTEDVNYADHSMEELIELWEMSLGNAKQRWPRLDVAAEQADMDQWLSEHGYIAPEYREE